MLALPFAALAAALAAVFAAGLTRREVHSGALAWGALMAVVAAGVFLRRRWGRMLGILVGLAGAGLAAVSAVLIVVRGRLPAAPVLALMVNVALVWALQRADSRR